MVKSSPKGLIRFDRRLFWHEPDNDLAEREIFRDLAIKESLQPELVKRRIKDAPLNMDVCLGHS
jgi:hypothetical protein